jgi:hypothetical protein
MKTTFAIPRLKSFLLITIAFALLMKTGPATAAANELLLRISEIFKFAAVQYQCLLTSHATVGPNLCDIAVRHADKTLQNHFRPNGSCFHLVNDDSSSGAMLCSPDLINHGSLKNFTGANQKSKVSETQLQDRDGNGTSLQCLMLRDEPDTPQKGCHAEVHLKQFPSGKVIGMHPGFKGETSYEVKFDDACNSASIGFFQYKNCEGPKQWKYLIALWREHGGNGTTLKFQVNPNGTSRYVHARLSEQDGTALVVNQWHRVNVRGNFTKETTGWVEISINGKPITWFDDPACKHSVGTRITGSFLPDLPGSKWQLQLGGYGFFKDKDTRRATVFVDAIRVSGQ